jgi:hypothetical protein
MLKKQTIFLQRFKWFFKLSRFKFPHQLLSFFLILFVHVLRRIVSGSDVSNGQFQRTYSFVFVFPLFFCQNMFLSDFIRVDYRKFAWTEFWNPVKFIIVHGWIAWSLKFFDNSFRSLPTSYPLFSFCWTFLFQVLFDDKFRIRSIVLSNWIKFWTFLLLWIFACFVFCSHLVESFQIIRIHSQSIEQIVSLDSMAYSEIFWKCF